MYVCMYGKSRVNRDGDNMSIEDQLTLICVVKVAMKWAKEIGKQYSHIIIILDRYMRCI